jgi:lactam utilization protein B
MKPTIDLNADLGESYGAWTMGDDQALLDVVTSANVACGFHGGDPSVMMATVRRCVERGVRALAPTRASMTDKDSGAAPCPALWATN